MAKKAYIGVGGVARKVKKGYIGVGGLARKIKKAYIGVGGVARPCWSGGELSYYGQITSLSFGMHYGSAASNQNYAVFGGGWGNNEVNAYDRNLVRSIPTALTASGGENAAAGIGQYAIFAGGYSALSDVNAYNGELTRISATNLSTGRNTLCGIACGHHAVFAGGDGVSGVCNNVDAYDANLTRTTATLMVNRKNLFWHGTLTNGHAIIAGGTGSGDVMLTSAEGFDSNMTHFSLHDISGAGRYGIRGGSVGGYNVFTGGRINGNPKTTYAIVDVYDSNLVHTVAADMSSPRYGHCMAVLEDKLLVNGGQNEEIRPYFRTTDVYDENLVRTQAPDIGNETSGHASATIGNFAIFAAGCNGPTVLSSAYAYAIL